MERGGDLQADGLLGLADEEQKQTLRALDGPIYESTRTCKQVLLRLDEALSEGSAKYDLPVVTIEHVLPQNPDPQGNWIEHFPDDEVRKSWVHRLGNLVLLSRQKNSSARNWSFERKKKQYFTRGGATPFVITSQVLSQEYWNSDVLETRQRDCLQTLASLWSLNA
ncbi:MAG TPA: HNH endonuclease family protein [Hyphomicrobiales bacterium]|nr:HNH endonuclease family protein [Hyphomicrobiales bacterium]